ncbi:Peroxisome biogenesis protein 19-1 [Smittium culicis]|uniref:Peroxisome biogenesis protein 19-1 n=1 Tax=Smittium culicis TaxID=133412 RepID=A0A1R1Y9B4_9FUNG|nr:Peroxisome biogenesis protein 19-1 [Smittium culicis]
MDNLSDGDFDELLDDVLDEYTKVEKSDTPKPATPTISSSSTNKDQVKLTQPSNIDHSIPAAFNEADFSSIFSKEMSEQLSKGLLDLLPKDSDVDESVLNKEMEALIKQFSSMDPKTLEQMAKDISADPSVSDIFNQSSPNANPDSKPKTAEFKPSPQPENSAAKSVPKKSTLKDKVSSTINKLSESNDMMAQNKADIDPFMGLLNQAGGMDGLLNEKEMEEMLEQIMKEMSNKEILYEPMKTLMIEYPKFFETKGSSCNPEDLARYKKQYEYISQITALFDRKDYDTDPVKAQVSELLEKTQECGDPPKEILDSIAPESGLSPSGPIFGADKSGFSKDEQCVLM